MKKKGRKVCRRQVRKKAPTDMTKHHIFLSFFSFFSFFFLSMLSLGLGFNLNNRSYKKKREKFHCFALHVADYKGCQYHDVVWQLHEMQQQLQIRRQKEGGQGGLG